MTNISIKTIPTGTKPGDVLLIDGSRYIHTGYRTFVSYTPTTQVTTATMCDTPAPPSEDVNYVDYSTDIKIPVSSDTIYLPPHDEIPTGAEIILNNRTYIKSGNKGTVTHMLSGVPVWNKPDPCSPEDTTEPVCHVYIPDIIDVPRADINIPGPVVSGKFGGFYESNNSYLSIMINDGAGFIEGNPNNDPIQDVWERLAEIPHYTPYHPVAFNEWALGGSGSSKVGQWIGNRTPGLVCNYVTKCQEFYDQYNAVDVLKRDYWTIFDRKYFNCSDQVYRYAVPSFGNVNQPVNPDLEPCYNFHEYGDHNRSNKDYKEKYIYDGWNPEGWNKARSTSWPYVRGEWSEDSDYSYYYGKDNSIPSNGATSPNPHLGVYHDWMRNKRPDGDYYTRLSHAMFKNYGYYGNGYMPLHPKWKNVVAQGRGGLVDNDYAGAWMVNLHEVDGRGNVLRSWPVSCMQLWPADSYARYGELIYRKSWRVIIWPKWNMVSYMYNRDHYFKQGRKFQLEFHSPNMAYRPNWWLGVSTNWQVAGITSGVFDSFTYYNVR